MAGKVTHKWAFKPGMRAGAYSWKSSAKAIDRLKSASTEIRAVARTAPTVAAECVIALAQRIWPAFEHIDTSSGALGNAVRRTLDDLLPILIEAPADEKTRAKWLEQLREAIEDDGVDYLAPIADRFGQIAAFPALMSLHADRDPGMIRAAWADHARFSHVTTGTLTLSCLLEAGRYDDLMALLALKKTSLWFDMKFGAEALLRQGHEDQALAFAEALLQDDGSQWGRHDIAQFCEGILVRQGREDDAYRRFGLPTASGNTYLAMWRGLVKRYPDLDARRILVDLIESHGSKGKWFTAAKTAKYLDLALDCAAHSDAAPATLIRAARDFAIKEPAFAAQVGLHAIAHLLAGRNLRPDRWRRRRVLVQRKHHCAAPPVARAASPAIGSRSVARAMNSGSRLSSMQTSGMKQLSPWIGWDQAVLAGLPDERPRHQQLPAVARVGRIAFACAALYAWPEDARKGDYRASTVRAKTPNRQKAAGNGS